MVVKIFIKPDVSFSLVKWVRQLKGIHRSTYVLDTLLIVCTEERDSLVDVPNAFPYIHCLETEKGGYLIRQYLYSSLYDRIRCTASVGIHN